MATPRRPSHDRSDLASLSFSRPQAPSRHLSHLPNLYTPSAPSPLSPFSSPPELLPTSSPPSYPFPVPQFANSHYYRPPRSLLTSPTRSQSSTSSSSPTRTARASRLSAILSQDALLARLSPATIRKLTDENTIGFSSGEQEWAAKAADGIEKVGEWLKEVESWGKGWKGKQGRGFLPPRVRTRKRAIATIAEEGGDVKKISRPVRRRLFSDSSRRSISSMPEDDSEEESASSDEEEYCGSLPSRLVKHYEKRIQEIGVQINELDVEGLKGTVLSYKTGDNPLTDSSALITATTLQLLPPLHRLSKLLTLWTIRLATLKMVPVLIRWLDAARDALESGNTAIHLPAITDGTSTLSEDVASVLSETIQAKVATSGRLMDRMLDMLEGREDVLPDKWIEDLEEVEEGYAAWVLEAERIVLEGKLRDSQPSEPEAAMEGLVSHLSSIASDAREDEKHVEGLIQDADETERGLLEILERSEEVAEKIELSPEDEATIEAADGGEREENPFGGDNAWAQRLNAGELESERKQRWRRSISKDLDEMRAEDSILLAKSPDLRAREMRDEMEEEEGRRWAEEFRLNEPVLKVPKVRDPVPKAEKGGGEPKSKAEMGGAEAMDVMKALMGKFLPTPAKEETPSEESVTVVGPASPTLVFDKPAGSSTVGSAPPSPTITALSETEGSTGSISTAPGADEIFRPETPLVVDRKDEDSEAETRSIQDEARESEIADFGDEASEETVVHEERVAEYSPVSEESTDTTHDEAIPAPQQDLASNDITRDELTSPENEDETEPQLAAEATTTPVSLPEVDTDTDLKSIEPEAAVAIDVMANAQASTDLAKVEEEQTPESSSAEEEALVSAAEPEDIPQSTEDEDTSMIAPASTENSDDMDLEAVEATATIAAPEDIDAENVESATEAIALSKEAPLETIEEDSTLATSTTTNTKGLETIDENEPCLPEEDLAHAVTEEVTESPALETIEERPLNAEKPTELPLPCAALERTVDVSEGLSLPVSHAVTEEVTESPALETIEEHPLNAEESTELPLPCAALEKTVDISEGLSAPKDTTIASNEEAKNATTSTEVEEPTLSPVSEKTEDEAPLMPARLTKINGLETGSPRVADNDALFEVVEEEAAETASSSNERLQDEMTAGIDELESPALQDERTTEAESLPAPIMPDISEPNETVESQADEHTLPAPVSLPSIAAELNVAVHGHSTTSPNETANEKPLSQPSVAPSTPVEPKEPVPAASRPRSKSRGVSSGIAARLTKFQNKPSTPPLPPLKTSTPPAPPSHAGSPSVVVSLPSPELDGSFPPIDAPDAANSSPKMDADASGRRRRSVPTELPSITEQPTPAVELEVDGGYFTSDADVSGVSAVTSFEAPAEDEVDQAKGLGLLLPEELIKSASPDVSPAASSPREPPRLRTSRGPSRRPSLQPIQDEDSLPTTPISSASSSSSEARRRRARGDTPEATAPQIMSKKKRTVATKSTPSVTSSPRTTSGPARKAREQSSSHRAPQHHLGFSDVDYKVNDLLASLPQKVRLTASNLKKLNATASTPTSKTPTSRSSALNSPPPLSVVSGLSDMPRYAQPTASRIRSSKSDSKWYTLDRGIGQKPIKMYVRLIWSDSGEPRLLTRIGGGWSDLEEYLTEYIRHHGSKMRTISGSASTLEIKDITPGTPSPPRSLRPSPSIGEGEWSRKSSAVARSRNPSGEGAASGGLEPSPVIRGGYDGTACKTSRSRPGSAASTSTPLLGTPNWGSRFPSASAAGSSTPPISYSPPDASPGTMTMSVSRPGSAAGGMKASRLSFGETVFGDSLEGARSRPLGLAGPRPRSRVREEDVAWVEGMMGQLRKASAGAERVRSVSRMGTRDGGASGRESLGGASGRESVAGSRSRAGSRVGDVGLGLVFGESAVEVEAEDDEEERERGRGVERMERVGSGSASRGPAPVKRVFLKKGGGVKK